MAHASLASFRSRVTHLFLLLQNHFHTIHGDHDAHFLLLDVLGFKLILQREQRNGF